MALIKTGRRGRTRCGAGSGGDLRGRLLGLDLGRFGRRELGLELRDELREPWVADALGLRFLKGLANAKKKHMGGDFREGKG